MTAPKSRPALGADIHPGMSQRDVAHALGVSTAELHRWMALAQIPEDRFERHLLELRDAGMPITASAMLAAYRPVPARGRVQRALAIVKSMSRAERVAFVAGLAPLALQADLYRVAAEVK